MRDLFPVVLGSGKRLFREERDTSHLRLVGTRAFSSDVVLLSYVPARQAPASKYVETFAWLDEVIESWQAAQNADRVLDPSCSPTSWTSRGAPGPLGDRAWRRPWTGTTERPGAEVDRFSGRLIKHTGDGILATFDAPTRALRCTYGLIRSATYVEGGVGVRAAFLTHACH